MPLCPVPPERCNLDWWAGLILLGGGESVAAPPLWLRVTLGVVLDLSNSCFIMDSSVLLLRGYIPNHGHNICLPRQHSQRQCSHYSQTHLLQSHSFHNVVFPQLYPIVCFMRNTTIWINKKCKNKREKRHTFKNIDRILTMEFHKLFRAKLSLQKHYQLDKKHNLKEHWVHGAPWKTESIRLQVLRKQI